MLRVAHVAPLALAVLLLPGTGLAQLELKPGVGITVTDYTEDPAGGEAQAKVGWQLGGTVAYGRKLHVEGGAFYVEKTAEFVSTSSPDLTATLSGVRIPVSVGYRIIGQEKSPFVVRLFGGGDVFIVTGADVPGLTKDDFESPTYGLFAGAGLDLAFLFVELCYEWSLTDASSLDTVDVGQSRTFFATAGARFPF
jgi:hypothetical protein